MRGALAGALGLAGLQVLVSQPRAYGGLGGAAQALAHGVESFLSPDVPAIPDRRQPATVAPATVPAASTAPDAVAASPAQASLVPPPVTASPPGRNPI